MLLNTVSTVTFMVSSFFLALSMLLNKFSCAASNAFTTAFSFTFLSVSSFVKIFVSQSYPLMYDTLSSYMHCSAISSAAACALACAAFSLFAAFLSLFAADAADAAASPVELSTDALISAVSSSDAWS